MANETIMKWTFVQKGVPVFLTSNYFFFLSFNKCKGKVIPAPKIRPLKNEINSLSNFELESFIKIFINTAAVINSIEIMMVVFLVIIL